MIVALLVLAGFSIVEGVVIFALLNRILVQAGHPAIELRKPPEPEPIEKPKPRKLFGVSMNG